LFIILIETADIKIPPLLLQKKMAQIHIKSGVFVTGAGSPLIRSDPSYIQDMFESLLGGIRLLCPIRRKAMVSWAMQNPYIDKDSFARLLRHSRRVQEKSYNRQNNSARTHSALKSVTSFATSLEGEDGTENTDASPSLGIGDTVQFKNGNSLRFGKLLDVSNGVALVLLLYGDDLLPAFGVADAGSSIFITRSISGLQKKK
jgi:hypothetical protein